MTPVEMDNTVGDELDRAWSAGSAACPTEEAGTTTFRVVSTVDLLARIGLKGASDRHHLMNGLRLLVRVSVRGHRRSASGLALIVALAGGLSLTAFASARRTASAFTRFLAASDASDLAIGLFPERALDSSTDFIAATDPILEAARSIPGVERDSTHLGLTTMYLAGPDGAGHARDHREPRRSLPRD